MDFLNKLYQTTIYPLGNSPQCISNLIINITKIDQSSIKPSHANHSFMDTWIDTQMYNMPIQWLLLHSIIVPN